MRIGYFVSIVSRLRGYERNVSGHIQIPLRALQLLGERGHEVHLITNEFGDDRVLPWCMPTNAHVHYVIDSRRRRGSLEMKRVQTGGVYPLAFLRQVRQIKRIAEENRLDVLHFSGQPRTIQLGAILKLLGLNIPTVATLFGPLTRGGFRSSFLLRRCGPILTATAYVARTCRDIGADSKVLRHGLVRDFRSELEEDERSSQEPLASSSKTPGEGERGSPTRRHRVLLWRALTKPSGPEVAFAAFNALASEFPHLSFDFAVRPNPTEVAGAEELCRRHPNVHLYRFPYPPGVSLARMIHESICVLMPFRKLSMQPQLAIAETLAAGVPVVTTDLESNTELIEHGRHGLLVPVDDVESTTAALRTLLSDPARADEMGCCAAEHIAATWDWDRYVDDLEAVYERASTARPATARLS